MCQCVVTFITEISLHASNLTHSLIMHTYTFTDEKRAKKVLGLFVAITTWSLAEWHYVSVNMTYFSPASEHQICFQRSDCNTVKIYTLWQCLFKRQCVRCWSVVTLIVPAMHSRSVKLCLKSVPTITTGRSEVRFQLDYLSWATLFAKRAPT